MNLDDPLCTQLMQVKRNILSFHCVSKGNDTRIMKATSMIVKATLFTLILNNSGHMVFIEYFINSHPIDTEFQALKIIYMRVTTSKL